MRRVFLEWSLIILLCSLSSASAVAQRSANSRKTAPKPSPVKPQSPAAPHDASKAPVSLEHGPSSPPQVDFEGGRLTIIARNSTMSDVLNAVRQKTGAAVDMPPGSGERVVGQFGPGAPRDVIAQLLNGSHFDYVLLGSPGDPGALKKIVLMAKVSGPEPPPSPQANQPANENLPAVPEVESENPEESGGEASPNVAPPPVEEESQPDQSDQQQNPPVVKTPEELLRELQQQQQQQQQQQEQEQEQNPPPGAPGAPPQ